MKRVSRIIGRQRDLERLSALVDAHAMVTVWGPAGIGKTRLVEEFLNGRRGVFLDLSEARTEEDVVDIVSRRALPIDGVVVLDNFEQVVHAAPMLRATMAEHRIVVTSRERLRVDGEFCFELGPLSPEDAMELFLERARASSAELVPIDEANLLALLAPLDGIPLAVELAAARLDLLGLDGLAARIERPITLLSHHRRDAPDRHATLEAAIAWSWDALDDRERRALMQCSSFRGGFTIEAAEAILDIEPVLPLLQSLRDKSMLRVEQSGRDRRFRMLESVRDFAERRLLTSRDEHSVWKRHLAHFARASGGPASSEDERANLSIAVERSLSSEDGVSADAVAVLLALEPLIGARGPYEHYSSLLDRALLRRPNEARLLRARGKIAQRLGRIRAAEEDLVAAIAIARELSDPLDEGSFLTDLGVLRHQERRLDEAESLYREALQIHRRARHRREEGRVLGNLGAVEHDRRAYARAEEAYLSSIAIDREVGDRRREGLSLGNLGLLEHERGELSRAETRYREALVILEPMKDDRLLAITLGNLGMLHHELGDLLAAQACHRRALELLAEVGDQRSRGLGLIRLGAVEALLGESGSASSRAAEEILSRPSDPLGLALVDLGVAFLDIARARKAWLDDEPEEARARLREARRRIERAQPVCERSDDARIFTRMLDRLSSRFESDDLHALSVGPGVRCFRPPGGAWRDLARRHPLRRMLQTLIEHALTGGRWLSLDDLKESAWPKESIQTDAARNRVYVALTTLRKLGLSELLLSGESGYRLDPAVPIAFCPRS